MASGTPPAWGRAWWRGSFKTLTARSSPRIGMALPSAAKSRVRRRPRVRSEWTRLKPATITECAVTVLDRWESLTVRLPALASRALRREAHRGDLPSRRRARYEERHRSPVPLVGRAVGCEEAVLLVQGAKDRVEGAQRREGGAVHRHAGHEQEEPERAQVARVAGVAERFSLDHLSVGAQRGSLRRRLGADVLPREELPKRG